MKRTVMLVSLFAMFLLLAGVGSALTASIGNAKMVINTEIKSGQATHVDRTVLVRNVNNVSVQVDLQVMGGLVGITDLLDESFILQPEETKKARFRVTLAEPGFYEGRIGVSFSPAETGMTGGAGLQSHIIIVAAADNSTSTGDSQQSTGGSGQPVNKGSGANPVFGILIMLTIVAIGVVVYLMVARGKR